MFAQKRSLHGKRTFLMPLAILILIAIVASAALIVYSAFSARHAKMAAVVVHQSVQATHTITQFLTPVVTILETMRQWSHLGRLDIKNAPHLTTGLIPLIDHPHLKHIAALTIADNQGEAYLLLRDPKSPDHWITRVTGTGADKKQASFKRWNKYAIVRQWSENTVFDPRERPWYTNVIKDGAGEGIHWTEPYLFFTLQKLGITASVKAPSKNTGDTFQVIGSDILVDDLKKLISHLAIGNDGKIFIVTEHLEISDLSELIKSGKSSQMSAGNEPATALIPVMLQKHQDNAIQEKQAFRFKHNGKYWWGCISSSAAGKRMIRAGVIIAEHQVKTETWQSRYNLLFSSLAVLTIGVILLILLLATHKRRLDRITARIRYVDASEEALSKVIAEGESDTLEFKSTLRQNLKSGKPGKEIEIASLKTVAAFMNSDGGALLVGVEDSGNILGIEADGFQNEDRMLLHFNNLIKQHIGLEFAGCLFFDLRSMGTKKILVIDCERSDEPVFLKNKGGEDFYIRVGPGSRKLSTSEVIEYLKTRV